MTAREQKIIKAILDVLHESDGGQFTDLVLHAEVFVRVPCSLTEFNDAFGIAIKRGWVNSVQNRITKQVKWSINDAGEAARLEM